MTSEKAERFDLWDLSTTVLDSKTGGIALLYRPLEPSDNKAVMANDGFNTFRPSTLFRILSYWGF